MADGEQILSSMYPGSFGGDIFAEQTQVNIRQHALESGCFVVNATAWLNADQQAQIMHDTGCPIGPISSGCFTNLAEQCGIGFELCSLEPSVPEKRERVAFWLLSDTR